MSRNDPFFWDTIQLGSKHAHHFFERGLQWLPLPAGIDSGHPPVFGYYLAVVWTIFGKNLVVSHFAMLPFLLLNIWLLWKIGRRMGGAFWGQFLPILVFLDPVLLGQSVMVSPDVVLVTSFLLALEGVWAQHKWLVMTGILGLCAISMRGMMTAAALLTWAAFLPFLQDRNWRKMLVSGLPFIPGFAFAAWFLWWHWQSTGWIGYHTGSPWAGAFHRVGIAGMLKNVAIIGWRWLDFGRVGELTVLLWLVWRHWRSPERKKHFKLLFTNPVIPLLVCLLIFLMPSAVLYQNLSAHRYFLPAFIAAHLLLFQWLSVLKNSSAQGGHSMQPVKAWLLGGVIFCMATGNCWIYPREISMDWDSTLAHWPYHNLRREALRYLEVKNIDFAGVGSAFPNLNTGENLMLDGDSRQFSKKDFLQNRFVLTSNVFNDISGADYAELEADWSLIWRQKRRGVWMELYEKRIR